MRTFLLSLRMSQAAELALRQALMDEWPTLIRHGPFTLLTGGEQVGVFSGPPGCSLARVRQLLHRYPGGAVWPAPAWARVHEVTEAGPTHESAPAP